VVVPADGDRDGLADQWEQQVLERFVPRFLVSAGDCDGLPAEFASGVEKPKLVARNGTIYGQVSPGRNDLEVEVHYYHLWRQDCGRKSHALDVEHVSVLLKKVGQDWTALYWYAGAHEDTVCDLSQATKAAAVSAVDRGPTVWISSGKHGSFLKEATCGSGCGSDRCEQMKPLAVARLVNLGERDAPLNGAVWTASKEWPLREKMGRDFDSTLRARLEDAGDDAGVILAAATTGSRPVQATIWVGEASLSAVGDAGRRTDEALTKSDAKTGSAVEKGVGAVGAAGRKTWDWLRGVGKR
jgi:hypothetical protein